MPYLDVLVVGTPKAQDVYCEWQAVREIDEAGALLIRPDGVVAWRSKNGVPDSIQAKEALLKAMGSVFSTNLGQA